MGHLNGVPHTLILQFLHLSESVVFGWAWDMEIYRIPITQTHIDLDLDLASLHFDSMHCVLWISNLSVFFVCLIDYSPFHLPAI